MPVNCFGAKYFHHLALKDDMHIYYSFKERFEYRFENREKEIKVLAQKIKPCVADFDFIVYPQSSSNFLKMIVKDLDKLSVEIPKNTKEDVINYIKTLSLQKKELASHLERLEQMQESLKINGFKASQRDKYEAILFKRVDLPYGKGLILDDSCFSGTTMRALKTVIPDCEYMAIFSK